VSCIDVDQPFIGGALASSETPVSLRLNSKNQVVAFEQNVGYYEWTGPAAIWSDTLTYTTDHVWTIINPHLPLPFKLVRAMDIDTMADYERACRFVSSW